MLTLASSASDGLPVPLHPVINPNVGILFLNCSIGRTRSRRSIQVNSAVSGPPPSTLARLGFGSCTATASSKPAGASVAAAAVFVGVGCPALPSLLSCDNKGLHMLSPVMVLLGFATSHVFKFLHFEKILSLVDAEGLKNAFGQGTVAGLLITACAARLQSSHLAGSEKVRKARSKPTEACCSTPSLLPTNLTSQRLVHYITEHILPWHHNINPDDEANTWLAQLNFPAAEERVTRTKSPVQAVRGHMAEDGGKRWRKDCWRMQAARLS